MRAHRMYFSDGELEPGVFKPQGLGMSVDWEKYSSAEDTRNRAKKPHDNAVIKMPVGSIREIKPLRLEHTPDFPSNRAHSEVYDMLGEAFIEIRVKLRRIADIIIPLKP